MPLNCQVYRNGKTVKIKRGWDFTTLSMFLTAALQETEPDWEYREGLKIGDLKERGFVDFSMAPIYYMFPDNPLWKRGRYTLKNDHVYGPEDLPDECVTFKAGDELKMWRD